MRRRSRRRKEEKDEEIHSCIIVRNIFKCLRILLLVSLSFF